MDARVVLTAGLAHRWRLVEATIVETRACQLYRSTASFIQALIMQ